MSRRMTCSAGGDRQRGACCLIMGIQALIRGTQEGTEAVNTRGMRHCRCRRRRTWKQGLTLVIVGRSGSRKGTRGNRSGGPAGTSSGGGIGPGDRSKPSKGAVFLQMSIPESDTVTRGLARALRKVVPTSRALQILTSKLAKVEAEGAGIALMKRLGLVLSNLSPLKRAHSAAQSIGTIRGRDRG